MAGGCGGAVQTYIHTKLVHTHIRYHSPKNPSLLTIYKPFPPLSGTLGLVGTPRRTGRACAGCSGAAAAGSRPRWPQSEKKPRFVSDTRFGTDCRSAVRPLRPGDSRIPQAHGARGIRQGAVSNARRVSAGEVQNCSSRRRRAHAEERWSTSDLQVIDLKAALSCSYMIGTGRAGSHTIIFSRTCMHHAPSRGCCQASVGNRRRKANRHEPGDRRRQHAVRRWCRHRTRTCSRRVA